MVTKALAWITTQFGLSQYPQVFSNEVHIHKSMISNVPCQKNTNTKDIFTHAGFAPQSCI